MDAIPGTDGLIQNIQNQYLWSCPFTKIAKRHFGLNGVVLIQKLYLKQIQISHLFTITYLSSKSYLFFSPKSLIGGINLTFINLSLEASTRRFSSHTQCNLLILWYNICWSSFPTKVEQKPSFLFQIWQKMEIRRSDLAPEFLEHMMSCCEEPWGSPLKNTYVEYIKVGLLWI